MYVLSQRRKWQLRHVCKIVEEIANRLYLGLAWSVSDVEAVQEFSYCVVVILVWLPAVSTIESIKNQRRILRNLKVYGSTNNTVFLGGQPQLELFKGVVCQNYHGFDENIGFCV